MASTHQADWSPNDWPESFAEMRTIDNLLRCSICYEFFTTAVLVQECSHNYCSLCIRQALVYDARCPTCFVKASGNDLKCNRVLDELVKNFINVRSKLLDLINKTPVQTAPEKSENEMSDDSAFSVAMTPRTKKISPKTRKGKSPHPTPRNKRKRQKIMDSDCDEYDCKDIVCKEEKELQAMEIDPVKSPLNNARKTESTDGTIDAPAFVECPVCGELINGNTINSHLDVCLVTVEKKSSLRSNRKASDTKLKSKKTSKVNTSTSPRSTSTSPRATSTSRSFSKISSKLGSPSSSSSSSSLSPVSHKKTPKSQVSVVGSNSFILAGPKRKTISGLVYAILSDKQLKQKLKEWNLSTQGDRKTLIKRHQEFVIAYNAQCDSLNPKSVSSIIKELEIKEKRKTSRLLSSTSTGPNLQLNRDASEEEVDEVHKKYLQQNQGQFEKLINDIRKRKKPVMTSSDDKPTKSVIIIDDLDSKQDIKTELSVEQPLAQCREVKVNVSEDDCDDDDDDKDSNKEGDIATTPKKEARAGTPNKKESIPCESKTSIREIKDNERQNNNLKLDNECLELLDGADSKSNVKEEQQVSEPPLKLNLSNVTLINDSDSMNDNCSNNDYDETNEDDDDTNDDKDDKDAEWTPPLGMTTSEEEFNEDENSESDEDLFASQPRTVTKARSLRRKKK